MGSEVPDSESRKLDELFTHEAIVGIHVRDDATRHIRDALQAS